MINYHQVPQIRDVYESIAQSAESVECTDSFSAEG